MFRTRVFWFFWVPLLVAILALFVEKGLLDPHFASLNRPPKEAEGSDPRPPMIEKIKEEIRVNVTLLLGKKRSSEGMQAFLNSFRKGEERRFDRGSRYLVEEEGLEALFDASDRLDKVVFHSDLSPGFQSFPEDRLPDKISFSDTQTLVHARLGEPKYGDERWDLYERPQYLLYLEYGENRGVLRISLVRPDSALPHPYNIAG